MHKRKVQDSHCSESLDKWLEFGKPSDQDQFYASLVCAKNIIMCQIQESDWKLLSSPKAREQINGKEKFPLNSIHEESIPSVDSKH